MKKVKQQKEYKVLNQALKKNFALIMEKKKKKFSKYKILLKKAKKICQHMRKVEREKHDAED